eukprot:GILJ01009327.1.p1 GENE.GILJ01009327.1~~GILJ01009327.1.p1  ORF type:complete len:906 (+),score=113.35 GILJ01009327.1:42-2720(+)
MMEAPLLPRSPRKWQLPRALLVLGLTLMGVFVSVIVLFLSSSTSRQTQLANSAANIAVMSLAIFPYFPFLASADVTYSLAFDKDQSVVQIEMFNTTTWESIQEVSYPTDGMIPTSLTRFLYDDIGDYLWVTLQADGEPTNILQFDLHNRQFKSPLTEQFPTLQKMSSVLESGYGHNFQAETQAAYWVGSGGDVTMLSYTNYFDPVVNYTVTTVHLSDLLDMEDPKACVSTINPRYGTMFVVSCSQHLFEFHGVDNSFEGRHIAALSFLPLAIAIRASDQSLFAVYTTIEGLIISELGHDTIVEPRPLRSSLLIRDLQGTKAVGCIRLLLDEVSDSQFLFVIVQTVENSTVIVTLSTNATHIQLVSQQNVSGMQSVSAAVLTANAATLILAGLDSDGSSVMNDVPTSVLTLSSFSAVSYKQMSESTFDKIPVTETVTASKLELTGTPANVVQFGSHNITIEQVHIGLLPSTSSGVVIHWVSNSKWSSPVVHMDDGAAGNVTFSAVVDTYHQGDWNGYLYSAVVSNLPSKAKRFLEFYICDLDWSEIFASKYTLRKPLHTEDRQPFSFAIVGDMGVETSDNTISALTDLAESGRIDFLLHNGDIAYADGNDFGSMHKWDLFMNKMERMVSGIPYVVTAGNHEVRYNFTAYKRRFRMPGWSQPPTSSLSDDNLYFNFTYSYAQFITVSSEHDLRPGSTQYRFLVNSLRAAQLNRASRPWTIVFFHRPLYCSNTGGDLEDCQSYAPQLRQSLESLFNRYKVDLVITSHIHSYERLFPINHKQETSFSYINPGRPVYVINGAGGCHEGIDTDWAEPAPAWSASRYSGRGFATMNVSQTQLEWKFFAVGDADSNDGNYGSAPFPVFSSSLRHALSGPSQGVISQLKDSFVLVKEDQRD